MQYITGLYALNIPCKLNTSGDWHRGWYMTQLWTVKGDHEKGFFILKKQHKELKVSTSDENFMFVLKKQFISPDLL